MAEITPTHVVTALQPIWSEKRETAPRVEQLIAVTFRWAVAHKHRADDPAGVVIDPGLPRNGMERPHIPALPYDEFADDVVNMSAGKRASRSSKLGLEFPMLTLARKGAE